MGADLAFLNTSKNLFSFNEQTKTYFHFRKLKVKVILLCNQPVYDTKWFNEEDILLLSLFKLADLVVVETW